MGKKRNDNKEIFGGGGGGGTAAVHGKVIQLTLVPTPLYVFKCPAAQYSSKGQVTKFHQRVFKLQMSMN